MQFCWGPLAFFVAYCIAAQHPARHALQLIMSLGQVYGDVLYYATSLFDLYYHGMEFCRPEGYYFWFYYFFMNFIWIAVGSCEYCLDILRCGLWGFADVSQIMRVKVRWK